MLEGLPGYLIFAAVIGLLLHAASTRFGLCVLLGGLGCSVANVVHEAWEVDWQMNFGWLRPMVFIGTILAMLVIALVGWPFAMVRMIRRR